MLSLRLLGFGGIGVVAALVLGSLVALVRFTAAAQYLTASAVVVGLLVLLAGTSVIFGIGDGPEETPYW